MKSMVDLSHEFLKPVLHKQAICVDATLGQGKDTDFFLSQNVHKVVKRTATCHSFYIHT